MGVGAHLQQAWVAVVSTFLLPSPSGRMSQAESADEEQESPTHIIFKDLKLLADHNYDTGAREAQGFMRGRGVWEQERGMGGCDVQGRPVPLASFSPFLPAADEEDAAGARGASDGSNASKPPSGRVSCPGGSAFCLQ